MTKRKNEVKVVAEILRVAAKGSNEGEIRDRCKLDSMSAESYLAALEELSMLSLEDDDNIHYRTTKKGLEFLSTYHRLRWLIHGEDDDFLLMRILDKTQQKEKHPFYVS
ncbi:MAG: hypothetical protein NWF03_00250 [Candidatus Bathyarchaeota archaeon]|nr:hypothetical protein [Candidatus Bathyarchaeota archaeon]